MNDNTWYPLTEKLPEDGEYVYFQLVTKEIKVGFFIKNKDNSNIFLVDNLRDSLHLTYTEKEISFWKLFPGKK